MGAMENNYEELVKVTEDLKSSNDQLMQKQDHIFNKMEEMCSFFKSTTIHGGQPIVEGWKTLDAIANKVIASHDGNIAMVSNMQIIGQDLLGYVSHFVGLGCYVSNFVRLVCSISHITGLVLLCFQKCWIKKI
jgi:hypothetical protein